MQRPIKLAREIVAMLLISSLVAGCQTFRPRNYQPPMDSPEYLMQRDRDPRQHKRESDELRWIGDAIIGLLRGLTKQ